MALGGTLTSLVGWIPMIAFIGWLIWRKKLPVQESAVEQAQGPEPLPGEPVV
jgi:hypothetical protein